MGVSFSGLLIPHVLHSISVQLAYFAKLTSFQLTSTSSVIPSVMFHVCSNFSSTRLPFEVLQKTFH
jgi:hypothetical protein